MTAPFTTLSLETFDRDKELFSKQLGDNFIKWGFCGVRDHNIDQTLIEEVIGMFETFFALPDLSLIHI